MMNIDDQWSYLSARVLNGFAVLRFSYLGIGVLNAVKFFGLIWSNKCVRVCVCVFVWADFAWGAGFLFL